MTLRELGAGTRDWFSSAFDDVTTRGPLDWPISVVLSIAVLVLLIVLFEIAFRRDQQPVRELAQRQMEQTRFWKQQDADQAALDIAANRLLSILNDKADHGRALRIIRARPLELRTAREEAALPILREAETSGATVDVKPVARMLDGLLVGEKRPEVIRALKAARNSLNVAVGDTLDTSVAGLYESRKALSDLIDGQSESNPGKFAQRELIEAKKALDEAIIKVEPRFGEYLIEIQAGSRSLDVFQDRGAQNLLESEADLRNVLAWILSPSRRGAKDALTNVMTILVGNPEAQRGFRDAVADVLVNRVTKGKAIEGLTPRQIATVYDLHRGTFVEIFSPREMEALDEVHSLLRILDRPETAGRAPFSG